MHLKPGSPKVVKKSSKFWQIFNFKQTVLKLPTGLISSIEVSRNSFLIVQIKQVEKTFWPLLWNSDCPKLTKALWKKLQLDIGARMSLKPPAWLLLLNSQTKYWNSTPTSRLEYSWFWFLNLNSDCPTVTEKANISNRVRYSKSNASISTCLNSLYVKWKFLYLRSQLVWKTFELVLCFWNTDCPNFPNNLSQLLYLAMQTPIPPKHETWFHQSN